MYPTTRFLSHLFNKQINFQTTFAVKNTKKLLNNLNSIELQSNSNIHICSFDIVNLFPFVPTGEVISLISDLLHHTDFPNIVTEQILSLTKFCLNNMVFQFNNQLYSQTEGLPMGSPLSPVLAEIFLTNFENKLISINVLFKKHILFWNRYVDDILCVFTGSDADIEHFLMFLNNLHPRIKFTLEKSVNNTLPFLDLYISINNNSFTYDIYRKPTTTDHVIPFDSNHPMSHKMAAFRFFFNRLFTTPLNQNNYNKELDTVFFIALKNNFPVRLIYNLYNKMSLKYNISLVTSLSKINKPNKTYISIPFIRNYENLINRFNKNSDHEFCISFTSPVSLKHTFCKLKDNVNKSQLSGIYKLVCSCGKIYIGKTKRAFEIRLKEHLRYLSHPSRYLTNPTSINECDHWFVDGTFKCTPPLFYQVYVFLLNPDSGHW
ncbi:hypothetical protein RN001_000768 [Aquatica leii]|uniref:Reverse transcriptase domain-containing protein n=1 Tax=Aquatica leii TaxID=1421715 RepID=A0AAN7Q7E7_9COLE|nr:hypothetical protein RN001_000768 [Aquatica leii]